VATNHKHESGSREIDKHTTEYSKKYAASLMVDPTHKCGASLLRVEKQEEPLEDTDKLTFICQELGKGFKRIKHLRENSLMHTNGWSYECEICCKTLLKPDILNIIIFHIQDNITNARIVVNHFYGLEI
jgi:hypothetical protein